MKTLVVAENDETQQAIANALTGALEGCRVTVAASEQQLVESLLGEEPVLAIIGYQLPWADGLSVVSEVRNRFPHLPILLVTAYGDEDVVARCFRTGISDYLPSRRLDSLAQVVCRLLGATAAHDLSQSDGRADSSGGVAPTGKTASDPLTRADFQDSMHDERFVHFARSSPGGIVLTDSSGRIVEWNRAEEAITGIPASEVLGKYLWDEKVFLVPAADKENGHRDAFRRQMRRSLATGEVPRDLIQGERTIPRSDGGQRRIRYTLFSIPMGQAYGIGSITWDVTTEMETRRRVEMLADELQQERDILRITMENTREHLAYLDPDFRFVSVNAAYVASSGYSADELIGHSHFELYPDPENQAIFEQVRDSGVPFSVRAKPFVFPNQPERGVTYWDWSLTPIPARDGKAAGLVLSLSDVTEHERAVRETSGHLRQTEELVSVAEEMLAERTLEGLFEYVVDAARRLTGAQVGYGVHSHGSDDYMVATARAEATQVSKMEATPTLAACWSELVDGAVGSLGLNDAEVRAMVAQWQLPQVQSDAEAWLGVRLVGHYQHTCAVILVATEQGHEFQTGSPALLSQLAGLASLGLQHMEAHAETSRRVAELDATISAIADGVIIYGPNGGVVRMNDTAQRFMAYTEVAEAAAYREHIQGVATGAARASEAGDRTGAGSTDSGRVAYPSLEGPVGEAYLPVGQALTGGAMPGHVTQLQNSETGEPMWVSASAAPIWSADGRTQTGAIEILTDVTELRMYQDRLETANAQLQQQAAELRTQASELVGRNRELRLLDAVGRDLSGTLDLDNVVDRVLSAIQQVVVLGVAAVWLVDRGDPNWMVRHTLLGHDSEQIPDRLRVWGAEGILGPVAESGYGRAQLTPRYRVTAMYGDAPQTVLVLPLHPRGELIGVIEVRDDQGFRFDAQVTALLTTIATWAAIAIENALLHREAQRTAVASERTRLAGELHDAVSQLLFSAKVTAESLVRLWDVNPDAVQRGLGQLQTLTEGALAEMRALLLELRPSALVATDIDELMRQLVRAMSSRSRLSIALELDIEGRLPGDVQIALYRIAQEALNNVMKHARATEAGVTMKRDAGCVDLLIWDNGRGFEVTDASAGSFGLRILRERAADIGAAVSIRSAVDEGTRVSVRWCESVAQRGG